LEKVDLYLGEARRKVTVDDVRAIVSETHSGVLWDLGNAIAARDLPRAMRVLDQLMYHGENAVGILLAVITPKIRSLWQLGEVFTAYNYNFATAGNFNSLANFVNSLPPEVQSILPQKKDGGVNTGFLGFVVKDVKNYRAEELRAALEYCLEANKTLVTGRLDPKTVLSMLLLRIIGKPRLKNLVKAS
jgi:DNA polymerase III subunit delta